MKPLLAIALALSLPLAAAPVTVTSNSCESAIAMALATFRPEVVPPIAPVCPVTEGPCKCGCAETGVCTCGLAKVGVSYGTAREIAVRHRLPMIALCTMANCPPCREMDKRLATLDLSGVVLVHLDAEQDSAVIQALEIKSYPSIVISGPGPQLVWKETLTGLVDAQRVKAALDAPLYVVPPPMRYAPVRFAPVQAMFSRGGC